MRIIKECHNFTCKRCIISINAFVVLELIRHRLQAAHCINLLIIKRVEINFVRC
jgi:hypothetical protein